MNEKCNGQVKWKKEKIKMKRERKEHWLKQTEQVVFFIRIDDLNTNTHTKKLSL